MSEVELYPDTKGYLIEKTDTSIHRLDLEREKYIDIFKMKWAVEKDDELYTVDQLIPELRQHSIKQNSGKRTIKEDIESFALDNWVTVTSRRGKKQIDWRSSFSRITGLFSVDDGFLITYQTPASVKERVGKKAAPHATILCYQYLDASRKIRDEPKCTDSTAYVIGTSHGSVLYLTREENNYFIRFESF